MDSQGTKASTKAKSKGGAVSQNKSEPTQYEAADDSTATSTQTEAAGNQIEEKGKPSKISEQDSAASSKEL